MKFDPQKHHRRSIRLKGYDYAQPGAYFVTIVAQDRACRFGEVAGGQMRPSAAGGLVEDCWRAIPGHFANVELGAFVVMPNHVHGIIILHDGRGGVTPPLPENQTEPGLDGTIPRRADGKTPQPTLGQVVAYFKYQSAKQINALLASPGSPVWQRNYYEHIIRSAAEHARIYDYILSNPAYWSEDQENPGRAR
jgi:REP element-mobilizing transposase RayT